MKKTVLYILRLSLTLLIITALAAASLAYVNSITKDAIAENQLAKTYCEYYGLTPFAGSDNHFSPRQKKLAGICFEEPICSEADFVEKIKSRKGEIFEEILG